MNEVSITVNGFVGTKPTLHRSPSGVEWTTFRVASTRRVRDQRSGEWSDGQTLWFTVKSFRTGARNVAVVKTGEEVRCGVEQCWGTLGRYETVKVPERRDRSGKVITCGGRKCPKTLQTRTVLRGFVRDRDGSHEREMTKLLRDGGVEAGLERFFQVASVGPGEQFYAALYDADTGKSADLGIRPEDGRGMAMPDSGSDRLLAYEVGDKMYVLDLAAIK